MRESLTSISNRRDSSWNFFRFERNSKPSRESMLTENIYIYIFDRLDVSGHANRGELVRFTYYIGCVSRVLVTNVRLAQQSTILSWPRWIARLQINTCLNDREEERGLAELTPLFFSLFGYRILVVSNRCFLKKTRNKKRFVSCLYYNEQGETGILWERREIIFNIKRNMLYIIGWDCVSNSIAGKATAFERIFPHILSKIIIDTRVCFFFLFELLRYDVGKRMCDSINTELWFWNWTTANIFFFYKDRETA